MHHINTSKSNITHLNIHEGEIIRVGFFSTIQEEYKTSPSPFFTSMFWKRNKLATILCLALPGNLFFVVVRLLFMFGFDYFLFLFLFSSGGFYSFLVVYNCSNFQSIKFKERLNVLTYKL